MADQQPQPGLVRLMDYLKSRGLRRALCTRNFEYVIAISAIRTYHWNPPWIHSVRLCDVHTALTTTFASLRAPVQNLIDNHLDGHIFLPIVTRDTPNLLPKPDPAGILHIASEWGLANGENLIMVGDSIDDMTAGHMAGAATVLLLNERNVHLQEHPHTDLCIRRLDDLIGILEEGFVGTREDDEHGV